MDWFYVKEGQQVGPVAFETITALLKDGTLNTADLVWTAAFDQQWKPISDVPEFKEATGTSQTLSPATPNKEFMRKARESLQNNWGTCVKIMFAVALINIMITLFPYCVPQMPPIVLGLIDASIGALLAYGYAKTFLRIARERTLRSSDMLSGFPKFFKVLIAQIEISLRVMWPLIIIAIAAGIFVPLRYKLPSGMAVIPYALAGSIVALLVIIYMVRASFCYSMSFFVMADNPELPFSKAIRQSRVMMRGYKWKLFCLYCRFIRWGLLVALTGYIVHMGFIWVMRLSAVTDLNEADEWGLLISCIGICALALIPYIQTARAHFYETIKGGIQPTEASSQNG